MKESIYNKAQAIIKEFCPDIKQRTEKPFKLYLKAEHIGFKEVGKLCHELDQSGFYFEKYVEDDGYIRLYNTQDMRSI